MESKYLVEEYMLLANILIAEHLYRYCWDKALLRVHPDLKPEKKEKILSYCNSLDLDINLTNAKSLNKSLE